MYVALYLDCIFLRISSLHTTLYVPLHVFFLPHLSPTLHIFLFISCLTLRQRFYKNRSFYSFLSSQQPSQNLMYWWMPTERCVFSQYLPWCSTLADTGVFVGHTEVCVPQFLPLGSMRAWHVFAKTEMASIRWYFFFISFSIVWEFCPCM